MPCAVTRRCSPGRTRSSSSGASSISSLGPGRAPTAICRSTPPERGDPPTPTFWSRATDGRGGTRDDMIEDRIDEAVWGTRAEGGAALELELARMRRSVSAHAREQGVPVARASVLNLVVFATREVHARRAAATIDDLAMRHPSRAIVVLADRRREGI